MLKQLYPIKAMRVRVFLGKPTDSTEANRKKGINIVIFPELAELFGSSASSATLLLNKDI